MLAIQGLSRRYGKTPALDDFSLTVARGEIVTIMGPDGAGKTTLIRILCRLIDPDRGTIRLDGEDLLANYDRLKHLMGYMPQQFSLYGDLSVEENLWFYAGIFGLTREQYRAKRDLLYGFSNLAPFASRRAAALSGGMKQKLALSCALMHDPSILVLDEPTTGVDPLSRRQFWELLAQLNKQGTTVLVTTPYMDEVALGHRTCFIFGGRKLTEGTPSAVAAQFNGRVYGLHREPHRDLIDGLNAIPSLRARRFGAAVHLYTPPETPLETYTGPLATLGIGAGELIPTEPSLEDRFIELMERAS